ncbi:LysE family translocator [Lysinibacillus sp. NPDC097287]|uniref:LysE family translocator n=1 Tax=Lysinibacillus sp. NPDC097287 TaxID=3364144 RepID=UPI0037FE994D
MFTFSTLSAFIAIVIGLFLIPGPAVFLTITRTVQHGRKAGIMTGLGIATGDLIHTLFAAIGLSAILMTSATAFNIVKYAGAIYLIYLGIRAIIEKPKDSTLSESPPEYSNDAYRKAIIVEVLNPKTALFFLAFLPQFVHPQQGSAFLQILTLGLIFVVLSILYTTSIVMGVQQVQQLFKGPSRISRWSGKIIGAIYIGLGLKVATQSQ